MNKLIKTILLALLCVALFTACNNTKTKQIEITNIEDFDLSDICDMNIGAEMPNIIYSDNSKAVLTGTFGVLEYSFDNKEIINRLSYDKLKELGIDFINAQVSSNGKTIYLQDVNPSDGTISNFYYTYDTQTKTTEKHSGKPEDEMFKRSIIEECAGFNDEIDKYLDLTYLIGLLNNYKENEGYIYTRAEQDWYMKNLEIVIYNFDTKTNKIYGVFNGEYKEEIVEETNEQEYFENLDFSKLNNGDMQLSISNLSDVEEFGEHNEGFVYYEKQTNQLHCGIITALGQPELSDEECCGSLAGAKVNWDIDIDKKELITKTFEPDGSDEEIMIEITDERLLEIGLDLYKNVAKKQEEIVPKIICDKTTFKAGEKIDIHGELLYTGDKEAEEVWFFGLYPATPAITGDTLFENKQCYRCNPASTDSSCILKKGIPYEIDFTDFICCQKDDPNKEKYDEIVNSKEIRLPAGNYEFKIYLGFFYSSAKNSYNQTTISLPITVIDDTESTAEQTASTENNNEYISLTNTKMLCYFGGFDEINSLQRLQTTNTNITENFVNELNNINAISVEKISNLNWFESLWDVNIYKNGVCNYCVHCEKNAIIITDNITTEKNNCTLIKIDDKTQKEFENKVFDFNNNAWGEYVNCYSEFLIQAKKLDTYAGISNNRASHTLYVATKDFSPYKEIESKYSGQHNFPTINYKTVKNTYADLEKSIEIINKNGIDYCAYYAQIDVDNNIIEVYMTEDNEDYKKAILKFSPIKDLKFIVSDDYLAIENPVTTDDITDESMPKDNTETTDNPAVISNNGNDFKVKFPVYQEQKDVSGENYSVTLNIELPNGWTMIGAQPRITGIRQLHYLNFNLTSTVDIIDDNETCIGSVGFNTYDLYEGAEDLPQAIYCLIDNGNGYHFDANDDYKEVNSTDKIHTAITNVYYSGSFLSDADEALLMGIDKEYLPQYKDTYRKKPVDGYVFYNKGVLSYNKDYLVYIAAEFDQVAVSDTELQSIAKSISLTKTE